VPWYLPLGEPVMALPAENPDAGSSFCCGLNLLFGDFQESFLGKLGRPGYGIGVDLDPLGEIRISTTPCRLDCDSLHR
jgi:hypothetical protein